MRNTPSTEAIACVVKWTGPEVGSSNPHEYQQQKKSKGKSEITWGEVGEEGS